MSSSTSSSDHWRFVGLALLGIVASSVAVSLIPWAGVEAKRRTHVACAEAIGSDVDYLVVGDSKTGHFSEDCLIPWIPGRRGMVFSADSVTPIFHLHTLAQLRDTNPEFSPQTVFISLGANNFNANGLHMLREHTLFNTLDLESVWALTAEQGEWSLFTEAMLTRLLPVYGQRVAITHLLVDWPGRANDGDELDVSSYADAHYFEFEPPKRSSIIDQNYLEIYRRSIYAAYELSPTGLRGTEALIELVREMGGRPVLLLMPMDVAMNDLSDQLVEDVFTDAVDDLSSRMDVEVVDLRRSQQFEFSDVNHLSYKGSHDLTIEKLEPILSASSQPAGD